MQRATNFVRGSARLEAVGPYPERFFNILAARGIPFWRAERVDETTVRVTVPLSRAGSACALGAKCLCEVRQIGRRGAPELAALLAERWGFLFGLALSLLAVLVLSRFVLVVDISGNSAVPDAVILAQLRENGVYPGAFSGSINARTVANKMLLEMPELSFLSVNLKGVRAEVVVREAPAVPEVEQVGQAVDLVARKAGRVTELIHIAGQSVVAEGDEVQPGQTLVSGTVEVTAENTDGDTISLGSFSVAAKAQVWAEVEEHLTAALPLDAMGKDYTGRSWSQYSVVLFGRAFKISPNLFQPFTYYDKIEETHSLTLKNGLVLPLALRVQRWSEYAPAGARIDRDRAEACLRQSLTEQLTQRMGADGAALDTRWSAAESDGVLTVTLDARCREQIAVRN